MAKAALHRSSWVVQPQSYQAMSQVEEWVERRLWEEALAYYCSGQAVVVRYFRGQRRVYDSLRAYEAERGRREDRKETCTPP